MWVFSNKTNLKCFWYLRHVSSFDPYDHLFKISHWKQCIVGGTWYLLLSVISTFQNWVNTKFCIGFAMICASYQHTTEYTKFAIETYAWVMVSDLQVHYVISNRNMTHLCQNIFNDKWKSNIIWQIVHNSHFFAANCSIYMYLWDVVPMRYLTGWGICLCIQIYWQV